METYTSKPMMEVSESEDEKNSKQLNKSTNKMLKASIIIMIIGWGGYGAFLGLLTMSIFFIFSSIMLTSMLIVWAVVAFFVAFLAPIVASFMIGIQLIRKQRVAHGVCILLFGWLSFGIWPFVIALLDRKKEEKPYDLTSKAFKSSLIKMYMISTIILIIGLATCFTTIGILVIITGSYIVGVQEFRRNKTGHGVCIILFGWLSLGIWPLAYTIIKRKKLKKEILNLEEVQEESTVKFEKVSNIEEKIQVMALKEESSKQDESTSLEEKLVHETEQDELANLEKSKKKKGMFIGIIIGIVTIAIIGIIIVFGVLLQESRVQYTIYHPIEVSKPYTTTEPDSYEVLTGMKTTFKEDGSIDEVSCMLNTEAIECMALPTYEVLIEETINIYENEENQEVVVETMKKNLLNTTCFSSKEGVIPCEDAVMYEDLVIKLK